MGISAEPKIWNDATCNMYNDAEKYGDCICDFEIYHETSKTSFRVPLAVIFCKSEAVRKQTKSQLHKSRNMISISAMETTNVEVVRSILFYLYTGFLVDLSVTDPCRITKEGAAKVVLAYDVWDLYKIARFLQITELLEEIIEHCVDTHTSGLSPRKQAMEHICRYIA